MPSRATLTERGPVAAVLLSLASRGPASRTELAASLGLSAATLTRATRALAEAGLVDESRVEAEGPGRPLSLVSLVPGSAALMGVKLTGTHAWAVVIDPVGTVLAKEMEPLAGGAPHEVAAQIAGLARRLAEDCGQEPRGIGISLGASVVGGRIVRVAPFLDWHDVPFAELVTQTSGLPVSLANDVRAFAYAEAWYGLGREASPFALLTVGAGIGCGLVVDGEPLEGAHGAAGSVGHLPVAQDGPACELGHVGCARALASTPGMLARAAQLLGREVDLDELVRLDAEGDPVAGRVLGDAAWALGVIAGALVAVVDPGLVVVSGEAVGAIQPHEAELYEAVERARHWSAPQPQIRLRPFTFADWARGAATLAVEPWALAVQSAARAS
ncbi:MAG: ROK family transcriptional regulator [Actinomyces urogenitalis]|uniref:ROK family transcriptional regulator n=5 Tax=root TaxID=1 RepID=A0A2I1KVU8_9ACTO|nr:ROK family transcriptional regulator [Actinomyces urogenitalis]MDU0864250.1 ROK family transcriptional regulator [Actinomyces urogenitalis]MDU0874217.1 ROK family transcriptional regulator [Actinomyces urogenitalis]MDU0971700.1 ROK family transcriptional regulator [Actinomyces urogenitalis]MDU1564968.1 ROK family transcriptional regulator [Actinomyces urogenitalis]MDU1639845.1 ROK family transcriptional regulator [Actinomyces urogenitalis]